MQQIITFLRNLAGNNTREWFNDHKDEYLAAQTRFNTITQQLIERIGQFDDDIRQLTVKDCTYRIYRDTRFTSDKRPYKTHMGCYLCREGKKSGYSGYYFHVGVTECDEYPSGHMLASGNYCIEPKALQVLRDDIANGEGDLQHILDTQVDPSFYLDESSKLKRPPKGYDESTPCLDLIKYKVLCLMCQPTTEEMLAPTLIEDVARRFETTKPFIDYINRAVQYVKEGNE